MAFNARIFEWCPSYEPEESQDARLRVAQVGDGYTERTPDGLNHMPRTWSLQFEHCDKAEADAIIKFVREHGGVEPFYWIRPDGDESGLYTCAPWRRRQTGPSLHTVTVEFSESFDRINELQPWLDVFGGLSAWSSLQRAIDEAVNEINPLVSA